MEQMGSWNGAEVALTGVKLNGWLSILPAEWNWAGFVQWSDGDTYGSGIRLCFATLSHPALLMNEGMEGAIMEGSGRR